MFSLCENLLRQLGAPIPVKATACTSLHSLSRDSHVYNISRDSQALQNMSAQGSNSMIAVSSSLPNMLLPATLSMSCMTPCKVNPLVVLATHKYWWCSGEKIKALASLTDYIASLESASAALTAAKDIHGVSAKSDASAISNIFSGNHGLLNISSIRLFVIIKSLLQSENTKLNQICVKTILCLYKLNRYFVL